MCTNLVNYRNDELINICITCIMIHTTFAVYKHKMYFLSIRENTQ